MEAITILFGDTWPELHGAITHFPVALLISAAFFDLCAGALKKPKLRETSLLILALAVLACIPAIITGRIAAGRLYSGAPSMPGIVGTHALCAYFVAGTALLLLIWRLAARDKFDDGMLWGNIALSMALAILVGYTGYLGGKMVFAGTAMLPPAPAPAAVSSAPTPIAPINPQTAALIQAGAALYATQGCTNCHSIGGVGGHVGPDLTHEGSSEPSIAWQVQHLQNPQSVHPSSTMPGYSSLTEIQLDELAAFLVSHK